MIMLLHYHFYQYFIASQVTEWGNTVPSGCYMVRVTQYFKVMGPTKDKKTT